LAENALSISLCSPIAKDPCPLIIFRTQTEECEPFHTWFFTRSAMGAKFGDVALCGIAKGEFIG
jgi:hypothetical protein